jgi:long-chain acyl-CoA synthetase
MNRLYDIVKERSNKHPNSIMLASKINGTWKTLDARHVYETSKAIAKGLIELGLYNQDSLDINTQTKIALVSPNRPEWIIIDLAVQQTGSVLTPIYPTISNIEFEYVLNEAEVKAVIFADHVLYTKFKDSIKNIPSIQYVFTIEEVAGVAQYTSLINHDIKNDEILFNIDKKLTSNNIATIIYTSGTTGKPKGVMLSHSNILSNIKDTEPIFHFANDGDKALSFLPLNHIFEKTLSYVYLNAGVSIYYAENMDTIGENLKEVKPIVFTCVPRVLEKVFDKIMNTGYQLKGIKKYLFFWAVKVGEAYDESRPSSLWYKIKLAIANKLIFSKWRQALGGNIRAVVSGAAALNPKFASIFIAGKIPIMEGYGLTETSPVISVNLLEKSGRKIGTVGSLIRNVQVKIADDGEVLVKGPNVMVGYYKNQAETDNTIIDGWLHTGDIGTFVDGRFLKITDRKKEIFKTSGGKYVAPQPIEGILRESKYIEQVIIIGPDRKFVSALIVPNFDNLRNALKAKGIPDNLSKKEIIQTKEAKEIIQGAIDHYNPRFNHVEQIKKFELLATEWSVENGILTPKLSMKRKVIYERFNKEIESMYS